MSPTVEYDLQIDPELPPCEGPKLERFRESVNNIQFKSLLSDPTVSHESGSSSSSTKGHGHVFEVDIEGRPFALKIFNFFHVENERRRLGPGFDTTRVSDYILTYHSDPFFAECRAYGRINGHRNAARNKTSNAPGQTRAISRQSKRTSVRGKTPVRGKPSARGRIAPEQKAIGKKEAKNWARASKSESRTTEDNLRKEIAVPCHGYLAVPASPYEAMIKDQYGISEWSRSTADVERRGNDRLPFRALVKTLVKSPTTIKEPRKMLSDLKMLRKMEVFQRDVFARNYKDGLLVDFSVAWTEPYWRADQLRNKGRQLQIRRDKELRQFDEMIEDEGFKTRVRACPAEDTEKKLRPRNEKKSYKV